MTITYNKDVSVFKKWVPIKKWLEAQKITAKLSATTPLPVVCDQVNRTVNSQFTYQRDGLNDVWFTPPQFVQSFGGDCEDFAIYKMHRLAQLGVPLAKTEIVICTDKLSREHHAVLRAFSGTLQYVLDNQTVQLLNKDSFNTRYAPIYAIGISGWRICNS